MKLLPNWCLTNTKPGFYDTESGTAIEQTARVYQAMNELINEYNGFADNCNKLIEDFINGVTTDNETFRVAMRQEFQDFIDVVELKLQAQDKEIADSITYIKNEISSALQGIISEMVEMGELDDDILSVLSNIETSISEISVKIDGEKTARENADEEIHSRIDEEKTARENADDEIHSEINNAQEETNNRFLNIENNIKYTTPELFGAVGDGVTDDTESIRDCITHANENDLNVIFKRGGIYKVTTTTPIDVKCSIDFNGSTIKVTTGGGVRLFNIVADAEFYTLDSSVLSKNGISTDELKGKSFKILSPLSMGPRNDTGSNVYYQQTLMTDRNGNFINGTYNANVISGSYQFDNVQDVNIPTLEIKNVCVDYSEIAENGNDIFIDCKRNNVCVHDVTLKGYITINDWSNNVIGFSDCCNIEIYNIRGDSPYSADSSGYILGLYSVANVYLHDCIMGGSSGSWGCIGISHIDNFTCERIVSNRIDCHYYFNGYFSVKDCTVNYIAFCGGNGVMTFDNVEINTNGSYSVLLRTDLKLIPSGVVAFKNCRFINYSAYAVAFKNGNYPNTLSDLNYNKTHIIFDNCDFAGQNNNGFNGILGDIWTAVSVEMINGKLGYRSIYNEGDNLLTKAIFRGCTFASRSQIGGADVVYVSECGGDSIEILSTNNYAIVTNNKFDTTSADFRVRCANAVVTNNIMTTAKPLWNDATTYVIANNMVPSQYRGGWNSGIKYVGE